MNYAGWATAGLIGLSALWVAVAGQPSVIAENTAMIARQQGEISSYQTTTAYQTPTPYKFCR